MKLRGPFKVHPLARDGDSYLRVRPYDDPIRAQTLHAARLEVLKAYKAHGVIADVYDASGKLVEVFSTQEIARWGEQ